jgi:hypothetical protein
VFSVDRSLLLEALRWVQSGRPAAAPLRPAGTGVPSPVQWTRSLLLWTGRASLSDASARCHRRWCSYPRGALVRGATRRTGRTTKSGSSLRPPP